ncbi:MAG: hypothetical protein AAGK23_09510 [Pseudomonadota bacterium]
MTDTTSSLKNPFWFAVAINFVWINISEVVRYFLVVKPMLHAAFPNASGIGAVTPGIFASWMVWDSILILAACGFYWLYLRAGGYGLKQVIWAATYFTITVFGLIWLGIVNMGLAPPQFIWAALPLAWGEQMIAAFIVRWVLVRSAQPG